MTRRPVRRSPRRAPLPPRSRRTLLFLPGDDPHKAERAAASGADSVVLDLEDGVAADRKDEARRAVVRTLARRDFGISERIVRINPASSGLLSKDLRATLGAPPDAYLIPKVESARDVRETARLTARAPVPLLALIESARGVVHLNEIAASHHRLQALLFGAEDLAGDLGAVRTPRGEEVAWARGAVVTVAAAFGLQAIDTIHPDLSDEEGLRRESLRAARMGYAGKMAIHPKQLPIIAAAFTPGEEEIARARALVEAYEREGRSGKGVFVLEGRMVDRPMVRAAERVLARARAAGRI